MNIITNPVEKKIIPFALMPEAAQEWLHSDEVYSTLLTLEENFGIPDEKISVIPGIITELITASVAPDHVVKKIKEGLSCSDEDGEKIATVIKEKILNPIAPALKNVAGVDLLPMPGKNPKPEAPPQFTKEPGQEAIAPEIQVKSSSSDFAFRPPARVIADLTKPVASVVPPAAPKPAKVTSAPKPFMLHEEKPLPTSPTAQHLNAQTGDRPSFSYDAPIPASAYKETLRPASARFGSSSDEFSKKNEPVPPTAKTAAPEPAKIVHYSGLKTGLNDKGNPLPPEAPQKPLN